jgi:hypothetical protein
MASFMFRAKSAIHKSSLTCRVHGLFLQSPTPFPLTNPLMLSELNTPEKFCIVLTTLALPSASKSHLMRQFSEPLEA